MDTFLKCPKCGYLSGDDWSQCKGSCPVKISPHFDGASYTFYGPLIEVKSNKKEET